MKKFGFIILSENKKNLQATIQSICNFKYSKKNIEFVVLSHSNNHELEEYCNYLRKSLTITYIESRLSIPELYNSVLETIEVDYLTFINDNMNYKGRNLLNKVDKYDNKLIAIKLAYYDKDEKKLFNYKMQPQNSQNINLISDPFSLALHLERFFIPLELAKKIKFDIKMELDCMTKYLYQVYNIKKDYIFLDKYLLISSNPFEDNTSKNSIQYNKDWYIKSVSSFILPELSKFDNKVPLYIQEMFLYLIYAKFDCNLEDRNKGILNEDEFNNFNSLIMEVLLKIDDNIIMQNSKKYYNNININNSTHLFTIPKWLKIFFLNDKINKLNVTKTNKVIETSFNKNSNFLIYKNAENLHFVKVADMEKDNIKVETINYKNGELIFDCTASLGNYLSRNNINIYVKYKDKKINVEEKEFYPLLKAFNITLSKKYCFSFKINIEDFNCEKIEAYAILDNQDILLNFSFSKVQARLSNSKKSFWHFKNFILYNKKKYLLICKYKRIRLIYSEIIFCLSKLKNEKEKIRVCKLIFLRMLYYITKPFYQNKHIWLTWDKLYKAGDNGEYIFDYALKHNKNIYYVIKRDSLDFSRLKKKYKNRIIIFNSLKNKLYALHAEALLKTHVNIASYCGFDGISRNFISGLLNAEVIEVTHGLTIQEIAQYQNRIYDNIKLYFCATQIEKENLLNPIYDLGDNEIKVTGMARFDGLKNNNKNIILITPTWRRNIVNSNIAHTKKTHNDNFKNSEYYKIYNSLINNKKLIKTAKSKKYRIIYLLHPAMSSQLEDYDVQDGVEIIAATGNMNYEKILTESSLMITDYSGVQFDFAYQKKPIIYYHPKELPPHYDTGLFDYKDMGFGPICDNEQDLVSAICEYMDNECCITPKYNDRIKKFFEYDDFNNCERIVNEIDNYLQNKQTMEEKDGKK